MQTVPTILTGVTEDDLIAALLDTEPCDSNPHGAETVAEISARKHWKPQVVRAKLRRVADAGLLGVTKVIRHSIDNRPVPVSAYYLLRR